MILFITLMPMELNLTRSIFSIFEGGSRLACNMSKCQLAPIHCDEDHMNWAMEYFSCTVMGFPMHYMGIPLSINNLAGVDP
jgi:hypothetical protein